MPRKLTPEQQRRLAEAFSRIKPKAASKADSIKVGLLPRATAPSGYERALERLAKDPLRADSMYVGLLPRAKDKSLTDQQKWQKAKAEKPKPFSEKKGALDNLVKTGEITQAKADSLLGGVKTLTPKKPPVEMTDEQKYGLWEKIWKLAPEGSPLEKTAMQEIEKIVKKIKSPQFPLKQYPTLRGALEKGQNLPTPEQAQQELMRRRLNR